MPQRSWRLAIAVMRVLVDICFCIRLTHAEGKCFQDSCWKPGASPEVILVTNTGRSPLPGRRGAARVRRQPHPNASDPHHLHPTLRALDDLWCTRKVLRDALEEDRDSRTCIALTRMVHVALNALEHDLAWPRQTMDHVAELVPGSSEFLDVIRDPHLGMWRNINLRVTIVPEDPRRRRMHVRRDVERLFQPPFEVRAWRGLVDHLMVEALAVQDQIDAMQDDMSRAVFRALRDHHHSYDDLAVRIQDELHDDPAVEPGSAVVTVRGEGGRLEVSYTARASTMREITIDAVVDI